MNTCPVYRRSGGHSYGTTVPGPIGSILAPVKDAAAHQSLPFACSLCGSCTDVCPVKIDLHHQLLILRGDIGRKRILPLRKRIAMKIASRILRSPILFRAMGRMGRLVLRWAPRWMIRNRWNPWTWQRDLPEPPRQSFRAWYRDRKNGQLR